jgi:hypothetical protein
LQTASKPAALVAGRNGDDAVAVNGAAAPVHSSNSRHRLSPTQVTTPADPAAEVAAAAKLLCANMLDPSWTRTPPAGGIGGSSASGPCHGSSRGGSTSARSANGGGKAADDYGAGGTTVLDMAAVPASPPRTAAPPLKALSHLPARLGGSSHTPRSWSLTLPAAASCGGTTSAPSVTRVRSPRGDDGAGQVIGGAQSEATLPCTSAGMPGWELPPRSPSLPHGRPRSVERGRDAGAVTSAPLSARLTGRNAGGRFGANSAVPSSCAGAPGIATAAQYAAQQAAAKVHAAVRRSPPRRAPSPEEGSGSRVSLGLTGGGGSGVFSASGSTGNFGSGSYGCGGSNHGSGSYNGGSGNYAQGYATASAKSPRLGCVVVGAHGRASSPRLAAASPPRGALSPNLVAPLTGGSLQLAPGRQPYLGHPSASGPLVPSAPMSARGTTTSLRSAQSPSQSTQPSTANVSASRGHGVGVGLGATPATSSSGPLIPPGGSMQLSAAASAGGWPSPQRSTSSPRFQQRGGATVLQTGASAQAAGPGPWRALVAGTPSSNALRTTSVSPARVMPLSMAPQGSQLRP